jgi:uncharacterized protein (DUF2267 family)
MQEPFALELYRRFLNGESADHLAAELHIPLDRIEMRLHVAAMYMKMREEKSIATTLALVHS